MNKIINNEIKNRLSEISSLLNLTLPALAEKMGVPYSSLYKWVAGTSQPSARLYEGLYGLGVNVNWFISGEGDVMRDAISGNNDSQSADNEIQIVQWVKEYWEGAEPDERIWLDVEMKRCFKDYKAWKQGMD